MNYSKRTIRIHWIAAFLLIKMLTTGMIMEEMEASQSKLNLLTLHIILGVITGVVSIYRFIHHSKEKKNLAIPKPLETERKWQNGLKSFTHGILRNLPMGLTITGILAIFLSDLLPILLTNELTLFSKHETITVGIAHGILSKIYLVFLLFYLGGILHYALIKKENSLKRIL